jgi:hypothetical protein
VRPHGRQQEGEVSGGGQEGDRRGERFGLAVRVEKAVWWWVGDRSGPGNAAGLPGRREKMVMGFSFLDHAACLGFGPVIAHLTGPNWPRFKPGCE